MDRQFRFQSALYLGLFGLTIWIIPRIEQERMVFTIIILSLFVGGLGRAYAWATLGAPPLGMQMGMALELSLPLLLWLQARVVRS